MKRYKINISNTNESYYCFSAQHLLAGMVSLGKRGIPSGCHGGGCGVCKIKIISGQYKKMSMSNKHISKNEDKNGVVLACRTMPESDLSLQVVGKIAKNVLKPSYKKYGLV